MKTLIAPASALLAIGLQAGAAYAGEADVIAARALPAGDGLWRFEVTVRHDDTGWEHYADAFEIVAPDGAVLGTRVLLHPHEHEQPFTRSSDAIAIDPAIDRVVVRARDNVHGLGGAEITLDLAR